MSLNIKHPEAHRLAKDLAELTGESMSSAVVRAVRERLERVRLVQAPSRAARMLAIGRDCAAHLGEPSRLIEHGELLYDARGLPR